MVKREIKGKYLIAAVITALIFILGMLLGLIIEGKRVGYIQTQAEGQKLDFVSLQLQYQLISELSQEGNCPAVYSTFEGYLHQLALTEERLIEYEKDSRINKDDFNVLKREYVQAQVNYWLLARKTKEICKSDVVTLLYFYSPSEMCRECDKQGFVLTYLKDLFKDRLLVFSFDSNFQKDPLTETMLETYNVTEYPSLVIDSKLVSGFHDSDGLLEQICPLYNDTPEPCKG